MRLNPILLFFILFIYNTNADNASVCNVNVECPIGFVCLGGDANQVDQFTGITMIVQDSFGNFVSTGYKGYCTASVPARQACYLYGLITGKFGRGIVALALISLGFLFVTDKIDKKQLFTFFLGTALLFGSFQIVYFITGFQGRFCEIIDLQAPLGIPIPITVN